MGGDTKKDHEGKPLKKDEHGEFEDGASFVGSAEFQDHAKADSMSQLSLNLVGDPADVARQLLPVPPDGGYGWVIVIAAFFSNLIVDGICTCFTEFKQSYKEHFKGSDASTALIGSLLIGSYLLVGPFVGGMCNKFGSKKTVMIGSVIAGCAFIASTFSPNLTVFIIIYGILGGIGFGMIYLPAIVVVGYYFESKRAVATGIAVAGSGVGTIVMPFVARYCVQNFGWQKADWVLAVLIFTCIAFACLYKELTPPALAEKAKDVELQPLKENGHEHETLGVKPNGDAMEKVKNALEKCDDDDEKSPRQRTDSQGAQHRPRKMTLTSISSELSESKGNLAKVSAKTFANSVNRLSKDGQSQLSLNLTGHEAEEIAKPLNRQDALYTGSVTKLNKFKEEGDALSYRASITNIPGTVIGEGAVPDDSKCKWIPAGVRNTFNEMIDLKLMMDPVMFLLCISNLLGMMGFYIPFVFLKDLALFKGISEDEAMYLVPIIGVTNTVGRVICGWLADRQFVSSLTINNFSLVTCGLLCFVAPFCNTYTTLVVYAALFGLIISAYICLTSIVLADLLGIEKLTNSFGLLVVYRGFACLLGTPFAGLAYDLTLSYDMCFYLGGAVILVAGLVSCAIPCVHRCRRSQGQNEGDYIKPTPIFEYTDNMSGKLSVLTERSEEALTEYQRTIQSLRQQHALLKEMELEAKPQRNKNPSAFEENVERVDAYSL
ncbi:unnamed protein product, partial [Mesorhabditis belari]|uniref:Major facilitator superfamily (MFS) profile domain-containing protein n=1 Tax=Mesorhabditis belari TaxID=2138241 RepID=A0AAF3FHX5_9BILA